MAVAASTRALARACHPVPCLAVTAITAGLCVLAGLELGSAALVTITIFVGQLSIGWSNDFLDAPRDTATRRADKPVATGGLKRHVVGIAAALALLAAIVLSGYLGWPGGLVALVATLCGWAYNLGMKATVLSWLPYAVAFGLLPAVATLAVDPSRWPAPWVMLAAALFGVAAHFANVLPDIDDDNATGVRGLPQRIGSRATAATTAVLLAVASTVTLLGPESGWGVWRVLGFVATLAGSALAVRAAYRDPRSPLFFRSIILIAGIVLMAFAFGGVNF